MNLGFRGLTFLYIQDKCGIVLTDDRDGKYYDVDLSKQAIQSIRDKNIPHMAPNHYPGPPTFVASNQIDEAYNLPLKEFSPALSNGKKINKKLDKQGDH